MPPRERPNLAVSATESSRVGLCVGCCHARRLISDKGSSFWLCQRAAAEPGRFVKYPPLPVSACTGFESRGAGAP